MIFAQNKFDCKDWHSESYATMRCEMIKTITELVVNRHKENMSQKNLQALPRIAVRLELYLYHHASSFAEYKDVETLRSRIRCLAHEEMLCSQNIRIPKIQTQ